MVSEQCDCLKTHFWAAFNKRITGLGAGEGAGGSTPKHREVEVPPEWLIPLRELAMKQRVGHGSTAEVFRAAWRGTDVAVKRVAPDARNSRRKSAMDGGRAAE